MFVTIDGANTAVFEHRKSQVCRYCRSVKAIFDTGSGSLVCAGRENTHFASGASSLNCGANNPNLHAVLTEYLIHAG